MQQAYPDSAKHCRRAIEPEHQSPAVVIYPDAIRTLTYPRSHESRFRSGRRLKYGSVRVVPLLRAAERREVTRLPRVSDPCKRSSWRCYGLIRAGRRVYRRGTSSRIPVWNAVLFVLNMAAFRRHFGERTNERASERASAVYTYRRPSRQVRSNAAAVNGWCQLSCRREETHGRFFGRSALTLDRRDSTRLDVICSPDDNDDDSCCGWWRRLAGPHDGPGVSVHGRWMPWKPSYQWAKMLIAEPWCGMHASATGDDKDGINELDLLIKID